MRERTGAGLAQRTKPMVARPVVHGDGHRNVARGRVEGDRDAHRAEHGLGHWSKAIATQTFGKAEREVHGHPAAIASREGAPLAPHSLSAHERTGKGMRRNIAAIALVNEDVLAPRAHPPTDDRSRRTSPRDPPLSTG